jgi:hypothetical protein
MQTLEAERLSTYKSGTGTTNSDGAVKGDVQECAAVKPGPVRDV